MQSARTPSEAPSDPATREANLARILLLLTALLFGYLTLRPIESTDFWWHASMGKATLEAGSPQYPDPVAASSNERYVNIVWLFDVPLYLLYRAGGLVAVNLMVACLAVASFCLLFLLSREIARSLSIDAPWIPLIIATLAASATHLRFIPRPQAVFLTFLPLVLWLGWRIARLPERAQVLNLAAVLVVIAVWAHVHSSVVIAPAVFAAASIRLPLRFHPLETPRWPRLSRAHWAALAISAFLPLTGPSGFELLTTVFELRGNYIVRHVAEMKPMTLDHWFTPTRDIFFAEILAVLAVVGVWRRRAVDLSCLALALLGLYLTVGANRFAASWAVMMVPLVIQGLGDLGRSRSGSRFLALATAASTAGMLSLSSPAPSFAPGAAFRPETPQAIRALAPNGVIFNDYNLGGYLGFELFGQPRVVIDSRSQMFFAVEEHYSTSHALKHPAVFFELDQLHDFSAALVPKSAALCRALDGGDFFRPAWFSETHVLFLPAEAAASADVSSLDPCSPRSLLPRCLTLGADVVIPMLQAMRSVTPRSPYLARQELLLGLQCSRTLQTGTAKALLQIAAEDEQHDDFRWLEGMFLLSTNRIEEAEASLGKAPRDHLGAQVLRLQILRASTPPRSREALPLARHLAIASEDLDVPRLRELLAWACEEQGDLDCAVRESLRAALSGEPAARAQLQRLLREGNVTAELEPLARTAVR